MKKGHPKTPIAIDCFAGCGGMTTGLKKAGFRVVGAIEFDKHACDAYKLNHPEVRLWPKDIKKITSNDILKELGIRVGELDLIGGCPPCQGFSTLRTYNGRRRVKDAQNDLIFQFQRLVKKLKPKAVMLENVPGLSKDRRLEGFKRMLSNAGYEVDHCVLDVANFGVPQRRRRLVLLANRCGPVSFAKGRRAEATVRKALKGLGTAGKSGDPLHDIKENRSKLIHRRIAAVPRDGGSRAVWPKSLRLKCHDEKTGSDGFKDVYGRMAWNEQAPTITTGCFNPSKGRFLHPTANRAITMREAALLQSFPKNYKFPKGLGKVQLATMIGNALPPRFIKKHARALLKSMQSNREGKRILSSRKPNLRPPGGAVGSVRRRAEQK